MIFVLLVCAIILWLNQWRTKMTTVEINRDALEELVDRVTDPFESVSTTCLAVERAALSWVVEQAGYPNNLEQMNFGKLKIWADYANNTEGEAARQFVKQCRPILKKGDVILSGGKHPEE